MNARRERKAAKAVGMSRPLTYSVLVHLALLGVLGFGLAWKIHVPKEQSVDIVQAHFIDADKLAAERKRREQEQLRIAEAKRQAELKQQRALKRAAAERKRKEEARKAAEAKKQAELAAKRKAAEARKQAELAAQRKAAEARKQAALAAKRKAAEARKQAALAAQRKAAEAKKQAELAAKRKAAEAKKQAALAAKRKAEAERKAAEAELRRQVAAEEAAQQKAAAEMAAQRAVVGYTRAIARQVEQSWLRPPGLPTGLNCDVRVTLIPSGAVMGVQIVRSSGNGAFDRSVIDAVHKASPLPVPADPAVFARMRVITFNFHPEN